MDSSHIVGGRVVGVTVRFDLGSYEEGDLKVLGKEFSDGHILEFLFYVSSKEEREFSH